MEREKTRQAVTDAPKCLRALGLNRTATDDEVKRAYRRRARDLHPDAGGTAEAFCELQAQYEAALQVAEAVA